MAGTGETGDSKQAQAAKLDLPTALRAYYQSDFKHLEANALNRQPLPIVDVQLLAAKLVSTFILIICWEEGAGLV